MSNMFSNAHCFFGVSNITKILKQVKEDYREDAMKSIIFESAMCTRFLVHGCVGVIIEYQGMINESMEELNYGCADAQISAKIIGLW